MLSRFDSGEIVFAQDRMVTFCRTAASAQYGLSVVAESRAISINVRHAMSLIQLLRFAEDCSSSLRSASISNTGQVAETITALRKQSYPRGKMPIITMLHGA